MPAQPDVQQVETEWATQSLPDIQVHNTGVSLGRNQAQGGVGQVTMGIHQNHSRRGFGWQRH